jgi:hypothetical protein
MKRLALLAALALAAPAAYADQTATTVAMSDAQLESVSGGGQQHKQHKMKWKNCKQQTPGQKTGNTSPGAGLQLANNNINVSPTIIVQKSTAITNQIAIGNKGDVTQTATTLALNSATVNYSVLQK